MSNRPVLNPLAKNESATVPTIFRHLTRDEDVTIPTILVVDDNVARNGPHLSPNAAMTLVLILAPFFLMLLLSSGIFSAKAYGEDSLPISIRATSQADYSHDSQDFVVPAISENILQQIIIDIPATGDPQARAATLQAELSSPVPTMTLNSQSLVTPTSTLVQPTTSMTASSTSPTSTTSIRTATPRVSPTPTTASVNTAYPTLSIPTIISTPEVLSLPTIPSLLPTSPPLPTTPALPTIPPLLP